MNNPSQIPTVRTSTGLLAAVSHAFTTRTRTRGAEYLASGAVRIEGADPRTVVASVRGSRDKPYICAIDFSQVELRTRLQVECTCPHFFEGHMCKHLYGSILAIDSAGIELVPSSALESRLDVVSYEANLSAEDDWFFTGEHAAPLPQANERPEWERKLTTLRRAAGDWRGMSAVELAIERSRKRQVVYRLDVAKSASLQSLVVSANELTAEGATPLPLLSRDLPTIADDADRHIVAMLAASPLSAAAAAEPGVTRGANDAPTASLIPSGYHDAALRSLTGTGRFEYVVDERRVPLAYDPGAAFTARAVIREEDGRYRLDLELYRPRGGANFDGGSSAGSSGLGGAANATTSGGAAGADGAKATNSAGAAGADGANATNSAGAAGADGANATQSDAVADAANATNSDSANGTNSDAAAKADPASATNSVDAAGADPANATNSDAAAGAAPANATNSDAAANADPANATNSDAAADAANATNSDSAAGADATNSDAAANADPANATNSDAAANADPANASQSDAAANADPANATNLDAGLTADAAGRNLGESTRGVTADAASGNLGEASASGLSADAANANGDGTDAGNANDRSTAAANADATGAANANAGNASVRTRITAGASIDATGAANADAGSANVGARTTAAANADGGDATARVDGEGSGDRSSAAGGALVPAALRPSTDPTEEVVLIRDVILVLPSGFVVVGDRIARWDAGAHDFARHLIDGEVITFERDEFEAFLEGLVEVPQLPPLVLPEPWRAELGAPSLSVAFLEPDKRGRSTRGAITFEYGASRFDSRSTESGWIDKEQHTVVRRDRDRERTMLEELGQLGVAAAAAFEDHQIEIDTSAVPTVARGLLKRGFAVEAEGRRLLSLTSADVRLASGEDWFDLTGTFQFGEHTIELPELLRAIRDRQGFVKLGDGTDGMLPEDWLVRFDALDRLGTRRKGNLRFAASQAALLDLLLLEQDTTTDERFQQLRSKIRGISGFRARHEARSFEGELREYQREGLGWMYFLQRIGLGGCLADDMGLGKTVQVLALFEARRRLRRRAQQRGPASLVVAPRSLIHNWIAEAHRFTPSLKIADYTGPDRWQIREALDSYDVIITTYGTVRRDIHQLEDYRFDYVVLDEAQAIKNANSLASKSCRLLLAEHRLALSGTPVENHLLELWSIFEFLNPKMLGGRRDFARLIKDKDGGGLDLIGRALRPMILRRTKEQVLEELPAKTELTLFVQQDEDERRLYTELLRHFKSSLEERIAEHGFDRSRVHVLEALLRLRQAACHPGLLDEKKRKKGSAKLDTLVEQLREVTAEGHKALVFSQFVQLLTIVKQRLDHEKIRYAYLDGSTTKREEVVREFQEEPECEVFLISLKAGGFGLNLTAADYVFILDPWWNPAVETQAIDRAHRIGQTKPVFAYRLITAGTVEEKILELHDKKRALASAVIDDANHLTGSLTLEDLELLLM